MKANNPINSYNPSKEMIDKVKKLIKGNKQLLKRLEDA